MFKIIERLVNDKVQYTVLNDYNERVFDTFIEQVAIDFIDDWESDDVKEGKGCNVG